MAMQPHARVVGRREPEPEPAQATTPEQDETAAAVERVREQVAAVASRLDRLAHEQVAKKQLIEDRWVRDLRQYHGVYEPDVEADLAKAKRSRLFVKATRQKTGGWEARLFDLLFPADEKNWSIGPTPVPELLSAAEDEEGKAMALTAAANDAVGAGDPNHAAIAGQAQQHADSAVQAKADVDKARKAAVAMESVISDQLTECRYPTEARRAIHDLCKLGVGIMKGPVAASKPLRRWQRHGNDYVMVQQSDPRPETVRVDPWNFFPDMSASRIEAAEYTFERHIYTAKDIRRLALLPGFDQEAIRTLLRQGAQAHEPDYIAQLRSISDLTASNETRFEVWEYHGPLETEELASIMSAAGDTEGLATLEDADPLEERNVIVWFCQGLVLKFGEHPLDCGDTLYSVQAFLPDETSMFGFGVPALMADSQEAINGAWRMVMDNGGLSVGPQIVVDQDMIEPADGEWTISPRKIWLRTKPMVPQTTPPFQLHNIQSNTSELLAIIQTARQFADDETNMPLIAMGDQGKHITQTANGMAILMNSANVVFRCAVKNWDDCMTIPNIKRLYYWNMQFNRRNDIKGDMEVDARGVSVLLVREMQSQNLMGMAANWSAHPVLGQFVKVPPLMRKTVQTMLIDADDLVMTDEEIKRAAEDRKKNPPPPDPSLQAALLEAETRLEIAKINRETALATLAAKHNIELDKLRAMLAIRESDNASKERMFAAEAAITAAQPPQESTGGGYL